jgi:hypothetical protein
MSHKLSWAVATLVGAIAISADSGLLAWKRGGM